MATATFSPRRHVMRGGARHRSHELIRYCSRGNVVGGISKLMCRFCSDVGVDDVVTCVDRDWGGAGGWEKIGFESVQVLPPMVAVVRRRDGERRCLLGAGVKFLEEGGKVVNDIRLGVPEAIMKELEEVEDEAGAVECLESHDYVPVYDMGVERLILLIRGSKMEAHNKLDRTSWPVLSAKQVWKHSTPTFPDTYYSSNRGVQMLLEGARLRSGN